MINKVEKKHLVIVGGGAGGLELAARLARQKKINTQFEITLIDRKLKHVWKPLLHEVAAGTLTSMEDELDYLSYAYGKFNFVYGSIERIDRDKQELVIAACYDENHQPLLPERIIHYDLLFLALGSISNDYHIPGVAEHCLFLDSLEQAETLNHLLLKEIVKITSLGLNPASTSTAEPLTITIVGGGATGIELAAELNFALQEVLHLTATMEVKFTINVLEASDRILPQLPKRVSQAATDFLKKLGIQIYTDKQVIEVTAKGLLTKDQTFIPSKFIIWAAGIKAEPILSKLNLETNRINQLCVTPTLQTTQDPKIFAFGDCAACPQINSKTPSYVPPRAQAATQQAKLLTQSVLRLIAGKSLPHYRYKDYGSLVSISKYHTIGNLMSRIAKSLYIEGLFARFSYWCLYKKHQIVLYGLWRVICVTIGNIFIRKNGPKLKLH